MIITRLIAPILLCSTNCDKDYIILETSFEVSTGAARRCGYFFNYRFTTRGNTVLVCYHTDGDNSASSRTASGFQISYESLGELEMFLLYLYQADFHEAKV